MRKRPFFCIDERSGSTVSALTALYQPALAALFINQQQQQGNNLVTLQGKQGKASGDNKTPTECLNVCETKEREGKGMGVYGRGESVSHCFPSSPKASRIWFKTWEEKKKKKRSMIHTVQQKTEGCRKENKKAADGINCSQWGAFFSHFFPGRKKI
jgi:hypothetical protein